MALPVKIGSSLAMDSLSGNRCGPFEVSGYLYGVFYDAVNATFEVWRAATGVPDSWSESDSANHLTEYASAGYPTQGAYDVARDGNKLYITHLASGGGGALAVGVFNMATPAWETTITGAPTPSTTSASGFNSRWKLMVLSDGSFQLAVNIDISGYLAIKLYKYESATWTLLETVINRSALPSHAALNNLIPAENDDGVIIFSDSYRQTIHDAPVLKTALSGDYSPAGNFRLWPWAFPSTGPWISFTRDSKTVIGFTFISQDRGFDATAYPGFAWALADNYDPDGRLIPDFRADYILIARYDYSLIDPQGPCVAAVWDGTTLYLVWVSSNTTFDGIVYASNKGKAWTLPTEVAGTWDWLYGLAAEAITAGIGFFGYDGSDVWYSEFSPTSSAEACGPANAARYSIQ